MAVIGNSEVETQDSTSSISPVDTSLPISSDEDVDVSDDETADTPMSTNFPATCSSRVPVSLKSKGDSFCDCHKKGKEKECVCGEENTHFEWIWDEESKSAASLIQDDMRGVMFHIDYSCGTAAVRGTLPMKADQYFWEIKMTTPVYGTDMMVGVCTAEFDLNKCRHGFCSMIGQGSDSWGLSYTGIIQHKQLKQPYTSKFSQGSIVGIHLDMWHGTLSFYVNRRMLGVAYTGLQGRTLYPVVSSTAARSGMKVICNSSFPTSLQFMCCQMLRKCIPQHLDVLKVVSLPPGLRDFLENNVRWLLQPCPPQGPPKEKNRKRTLENSDSKEDESRPNKRIRTT